LIPAKATQAFRDIQPLLKPPVPERSFQNGERIEHEKYGWGVIQNVRQAARGVQISVYFDSGTETKFLASSARSAGPRLRRALNAVPSAAAQSSPGSACAPGRQANTGRRIVGASCMNSRTTLLKVSGSVKFGR